MWCTGNIILQTELCLFGIVYWTVWYLPIRLTYLSLV